MKMQISRPSMPKIGKPNLSFRRTKASPEAAPEEETVSTTVTKVPRRGVLGKMGLKKKEKTTIPKTEEPAKEEPVEEPVVEETPVEEPAAEPTDAPAAEEASEETPEEEATEEREEEEPAEEEAPVEEAPVEEAAEEREQPDEAAAPSTGLLCGCV